MTTSLQAWESYLGGSESPDWTTDPYHPFWYDNDVAPMGVGSVGTDDGALRVAAFLACVRVLGESISGLPCILFEREDGGGRKRASQHGQYRTLHDSPDGLMTAQEFWELCVTRMILRGNFVAKSSYTLDGPNTRLDWVDTDQATKSPPITKMSDGSWRFYYMNDDDREVYLSTQKNDFFHVKGMTLDGMWGLSPLTMLRLQLESADKARKAGTNFFDNGMTPTGTFQSEQKFSDKAYARLKAQIENKSGYRQMHKPLILEEGMQFNPIAMSHADAQFLELRKFDKAEIAGVLRVPLHMIQDLDRATFSNIEHQSLEFAVHTLRPWLKRIEHAIKLRMIIRPRQYYAEFLIDDLLRGDTQSRYEAYSSAISNLWMSPNEVRERENLNPRKGGDEFKNPSINPEKDADSMKKKQVESGQPFRKAVAVFAGDIASRISSAAHRDVKNRVKHSGEDPDRFQGWLQDWLNSHAQHIDNMLSPFCQAFDVQQSHRTSCVTEIIESSGKQLRDDPQNALVWLESKGASRFETIIKELVT